MNAPLYGLLALQVVGLLFLQAAGQLPPDLTVLEAEKDLVFNSTARVFPVSSIASASLIKGSGLVRIDPFNNFPAIAGNGISGGYSTLASCITYPPHVHLRALEYLYIVQGTLTVTVVGELNAGQQSMTYTVPTGALTYIPKAHVHTESNLGCETVIFLSTLTSEDPGTQFFPTALLTFPRDILAASFGSNSTVQAAVLSALSAVSPIPNPFLPIPNCGTTCPGTAAG